jgi:phenylacetate-coenzyme A ligase PaaK-like adenylate-forming protein
MSVVNTAASRRSLAMHNLRQGLQFAYTRDVFPDGSPVNADFAFWEGHNIDGRPPVFINRALSAERRLDLLHELKADVLVDFPTATEVLARFNLRRRPALKLSHVIGYGMGVNEIQRDLNQQSFGAATLSSYDSKEGGAMAYQCPHSPDRFHVNTELLLAETIPDVRGIVITPFFQAAQPFVRYVLDDDVELAASCPCGHRHQTILSISGKADPIFHFPGNTLIVPFEPIVGKTEIYRNSMAMQIAQTAEATIEVRYVSAVEASAAAKSDLTTMLIRMWHPSLTVVFCNVTAIPANSGGKQQRFVREI